MLPCRLFECAWCGADCSKVPIWSCLNLQLDVADLDVACALFGMTAPVAAVVTSVQHLNQGEPTVQSS
jgi:hypothetical protein